MAWHGEYEAKKSYGKFFKELEKKPFVKQEWKSKGSWYCRKAVVLLVFVAFMFTEIKKGQTLVEVLVDFPLWWNTNKVKLLVNAVHGADITRDPSDEA
jgi:hypothetical protein